MPNYFQFSSSAIKKRNRDARGHGGAAASIVLRWWMLCVNRNDLWVRGKKWIRLGMAGVLALSSRLKAACSIE